MDYNSKRLLENITPDMIAEYLRSTGWKYRTRLRSGADLFECQSTQLMIPRDDTYDDFTDILSNAINKLAQQLESTTSSICDKILFLNSEVVDFRAIGKNSENGTLPFKDWLQHGNGIKETLLSAKRYTLDPSPYHKKVSTSRTEQWLNSCLMGQTQIGSYVSKVFIPLKDTPIGTHKAHQPEQVPLLEELEQAPPGRKVINTILETAALVQGATDYKKVEQLLRDNEEKPILNANLCRALSELINFEDGGSVEIKVSPSPLSKFPVSKCKVHVTHTSKPALNDIVEAITPKPTTSQSTFDVFIFGNEKHPKKDEGHGLVKCVTFQDGKEFKFNAHLSEVNYYKAVREGHTKNKTIRISGTLVKRGNTKLLEDITQFDIL